MSQNIMNIVLTTISPSPKSQVVTVLSIMRSMFPFTKGKSNSCRKQFLYFLLTKSLKENTCNNYPDNI